MSGSNAGALLELAREGIDVGIAEAVGDLFERQVAAGQEGLDFFDAPPDSVFGRRNFVGAGEKPPEPRIGEPELGGDRFDRNPFLRVALEQRGAGGNDAVERILAGFVEQQFAEKTEKSRS